MSTIRVVAECAHNPHCSEACVVFEHQAAIHQLQADKMSRHLQVIGGIQQHSIWNKGTESHGDHKPERKEHITHERTLKIII